MSGRQQLMAKEGKRMDATLVSSSAAEIPKADTVLDGLKTKDWLDGQDYDLFVASKAETLELLETQDVEELQERIASLQSDLLKISSDQTVKELIVKRVQFDQALSDKMFTLALPSTGDNSEGADSEQGKDIRDRRQYEELLQARSQLTSCILRKNQIVTDLQKELDTIRKRNFELKKNNRTLMDALGQHRQSLERMADDVKSNAACRGLKEELESTVSRVEIAQCTLQALIVGSGVNWAQDPDLLETVTLCGDSLHL